jgi:hypothetical protein
MTERRSKRNLALRLGLWVLFIALVAALVVWLVPVGWIGRLV